MGFLVLHLLQARTGRPRGEINSSLLVVDYMSELGGIFRPFSSSCSFLARLQKDSRRDGPFLLFYESFLRSLVEHPLFFSGSARN